MIEEVIISQKIQNYRNQIEDEFNENSNRKSFWRFLSIAITILWIFSSIISPNPLLFLFALPILGIIFTIPIVLCLSEFIDDLINAETKKEKKIQTYKNTLEKLLKNYVSLNFPLLYSPYNCLEAFESIYDLNKIFSTEVNSIVYQNLYYPIKNKLTESEKQIVIDYLRNFTIGSEVSSNDNLATFYIKVKTVKETDLSKINKQKQYENLKESEKIRILETLKNPFLRRRDDIGKKACAVYIMQSKIAIKVGISIKPESRLREINTGHPERIHLTKIWWFFNTKDAELVELNIHNALREKGLHKKGEWFEPQAEIILNTSEMVIKYLKEKSLIDDIKSIDKIFKTRLTSPKFKSLLSNEFYRN